MTYFDLKPIAHKMHRLSEQIKRHRSEAERITPKMSHAPAGSGTSDKVGATVARYVDMMTERDALKRMLDAEIEQIPDHFERRCIRLKLIRRCTWVAIAHKMGGGNTADSVRMRVKRYRW